MQNATVTTTQKSSKDLRFSTTKTVGKESITVKIRLSDECKNGHQDFSITGDIYEAYKPKVDRYHISGGCIHEDILKHFPEFKIFISLHLADYEGIPMCAVENGFYHLRHGFNNTPTGHLNFKSEYCEYYRITPTQYDVLSQSRNELQYALNLESLGILAQWKEQANEAIKILEGLTDTAFIVDSPKSQYNRPTAEEVIQEQEREKAGYYTKEAEQKREKAKKGGIIKKLQEDRDKGIKQHQLEYDVKVAVLNAGGEKALKNCIFYNHTNTLAFNWKSYDMLQQSEIDAIVEAIQLPEGITIENKKGK